MHTAQLYTQASVHASRIAMLLHPAHHRNDDGISMRPYGNQLSLFGTLYGVKHAKRAVYKTAWAN